MFTQLLIKPLMLSRTALVKFLIVMATILAIGLSTAADYGFSFDETFGILVVKNNIDLMANHQPFPSEVMKYDGTLFNFVSEAVYQAQEKLRNVLSIPDSSSRFVLPTQVSENERIEAAKDQEIRKRIAIKHPLTFLTSTVAYVSIAGIVGIICGFNYAWIAPVILALFPRFWGHSFFNFKDVPFAALFTLSTFVGSYLVNQYIRVEGSFKKRFSSLAIAALLYGVLIGLLAGVRVGALVLISFTLIAYVVVRVGLPKKEIQKDLFLVLCGHGFSLIGALVTTIVCYPASWQNPFDWLLNAGKVLAKYPWQGEILFNGDFISAQSLPWYYTPTWLWITVPLIVQFFFLLGIVFIVKQYTKFSNLQRACIILTLLQIFLLPTIAIIQQTTIYNEIRHFLFILPGVAAVASMALVWAYQELPKKSLQRFAIGLVAVFLVQIGFEMIALHPYQYLYFNQVAGGLANAHKRYEVDYWNLSMREGMEWINHRSPRYPVLISRPYRAGSIFATPNVRHFRYDPLLGTDPSSQVSRPYYYLVPYASSYRSSLANCRVVHQVIRQQTPLTEVQQCD